jgi:GT2 family glycosyltransferase
MTLDCLRSIMRETKAESYEILLVDNASNDGTIEAVRSEMPHVRCFALSENVGFARANNVAAEQASGRLLLLLNPDTVVLDHAIDRLVDFSRARPAAKIWGGQSLRADLTIDPTSCWDRLTERQVDIVCGCFLLIERDMWRKLGGFDGNFFLYGEEADLCLRAEKIGARPTFTPDATIIHYSGASHQLQSERTIRALSARADLISRHIHPGRRFGLFVNSLTPLVRALGYGIAGRLSGRSHAREAAKTWWTVWQRRAEWQSGFSSLPTCQQFNARQKDLKPDV